MHMPLVGGSMCIIVCLLHCTPFCLFVYLPTCTWLFVPVCLSGWLSVRVYAHERTCEYITLLVAK